MKIVVDYKKDDAINSIKINSAKYLSDYVIRILFSDGTEHTVDFKQFLQKALHPSIKKYLDENKFKSFDLVDGNLNWNDHDLIFPLEDLYEGTIILK